jgi:hypothetical protein
MIRSFLSAHDLSDKTLIPLVTHGGYGLGNSQQILAGHKRRDGAGLDRGGGGVVFRGQGAEDRLGNAKRFKSYVSHKSP